jgi:hypothetical protein
MSAAISAKRGLVRGPQVAHAEPGKEEERGQDREEEAWAAKAVCRHGAG